MNNRYWQILRIIIISASLAVFSHGWVAACEIDFEIMEQSQSSQTTKNVKASSKDQKEIVKEIKLKTDQDQAVADTKKKTIYQVGDVFTSKVTVTLTHRVCPTAIDKTKFKFNGLKVIGATKWKQLSTMVYTRRLKIKVIGTDDGKLLVTAVRTCDKDGGYGSMTLKSEPLAAN